MTAQRVSLRVWVKNLRPEKEFFFPYHLGSQKRSYSGFSFLAAVRIWSVALEDIFVALLAIRSKTDLVGFVMEQEGS